MHGAGMRFVNTHAAGACGVAVAVLGTAAPYRKRSLPGIPKTLPPKDSRGYSRCISKASLRALVFFCHGSSQRSYSLLKRCLGGFTNRLRRAGASEGRLFPPSPTTFTYAIVGPITEGEGPRAGDVYPNPIVVMAQPQQREEPEVSCGSVHCIHATGRRPRGRSSDARPVDRSRALA